MCTGRSIKEANGHFYSGSSLKLSVSFKQGILCQIKINKHVSEHLMHSKYYLYGSLTTDKGLFLKKSVLDMEFGEWQIKIKKHGLGYNGGPCEK